VAQVTRQALHQVKVMLVATILTAQLPVAVAVVQVQ
jgi:hypothetical protein